ncbi:hypothetical protein Dvina_49010 [Dactylosporangium vinaceum]|uniref:Uncharacterized protein n=1 Tax=Dactylosporangium vinaceum TaxID=53362 RepID=A0ABV5LYA1_9ACTN|nr:hypothetical protein [Dactylosporangium vinaceum]UAB95835.1 hypothetical protein Dvina_49010 [Dactylosporangium vinaceum]
MIRAISSWATAAMVFAAAAALTNLAMAFLPVVDLHAVHHPGPATTALATALRLVAGVLLGGFALAFAVAWAGWSSRARKNLQGFGVRSRRVVDSIGRAPDVRRRMTTLTWALRGAVLAGGLALLLAWLGGRSTAGEIADVRAQARSGHPVDDALAAHLFGREVLLYLPSAALFVLVAVLALLFIARVTSAQYGRVARLSGDTGLAGGDAVGRRRLGARDDAVALVGGTIRA